MHHKNSPRPLIFGEVLYDRFPDGSVVLGGAPFNVAWHLQAFGQSPLFVSRIGNDSLGRRIRSAMQTWDMDTSGLQLDSEHPTGTVDVHIEQGEPKFDIAAERAYDHIRADSIPPLEPSLLYHGTLALRNTVSAQTLDILKNNTDTAVFLDVNLRPPWWEVSNVNKLLDDARWAKLNEHELEALVTDESNLNMQAGLLLQRHHLELIIVTRGSEGAILFSREGPVAEARPAADTRVVDSVGAGDAFTSVVILGLMLQWPLQLLMTRAQDFASTIVGVRGATIQDKEFYAQFIEQWGLSAP